MYSSHSLKLGEPFTCKGTTGPLGGTTAVPESCFSNGKPKLTLPYSFKLSNGRASKNKLASKTGLSEASGVKKYSLPSSFFSYGAFHIDFKTSSEAIEPPIRSVLFSKEATADSSSTFNLRLLFMFSLLVCSCVKKMSESSPNNSLSKSPFAVSGAVCCVVCWAKMQTARANRVKSTICFFISVYLLQIRFGKYDIGNIACIKVGKYLRCFFSLV